MRGKKFWNNTQQNYRNNKIRHAFIIGKKIGITNEEVSVQIFRFLQTG